MDVQMNYQSDQLDDKDSYVTIEFYNNINNTLQFLGFTQIDTYGTDNGVMSNNLCLCKGCSREYQ
jgi:hypothetical protein